MKKIIPILFLLCLLCACEDCDEVTYHKTIGVGYILVYDNEGNLQPVPGGGVTVTTAIGKTGGWFSKDHPEEYFSTDETGKFQVRFIKRADCADATKYFYSVSANLGSNYGTFDGAHFSLSIDDIKNAPNNVVFMGTIRFTKRY